MDKERKELPEDAIGDEEDIDLLLARYGIVLDDLDIDDIDEAALEELEGNMPPEEEEEETVPPSAEMEETEEPCEPEQPEEPQRRSRGGWLRRFHFQKDRAAKPEEAEEAPEPEEEQPEEDGQPEDAAEEDVFPVADVVASTVDSVLEERKEEERRFEKQRRRQQRAQEKIHRSNTQRAADTVEFPEEEPSLAEATVLQKRRFLRLKKHAAAASLLTLLCWIPIVVQAAGVQIPYYGTDVRIYAAVTAVLELLVCIAAWPVFAEGFGHLRVSCHTCVSLCSVLTLADTLSMLFLTQRGAMAPLGAISAVALSLTLWGDCWHAGALREGFRLVALGEPSYVVDLTEYGALKQRGRANSFYHRTMKEDGASLWQGLLLPVVLVGSVVFAVLSSFGLGHSENFLWCWSAILTAGTALALPCVYSMPYYRLAKRLGKSGCAVAGLYGAKQLSYSREMLINDTDLFPPGTIRMKEVKVIGEERRKVASYAGSLAQAYGSGWTDLFTAFLQETGAKTEHLEHFHVHEEGGISASIHGETAVLGVANLIRKLSIRLPKSMEWKDGLFLAVDGELVAIFCMVYQPTDSVRWSLGAMRRNGITPLLATRDPNLTPKFLKSHFGTEGGGLLLDLNERLNLSLLREEGGARPNALLYREGLAPYFEAVAGSKRLCRAVKWGNAITLLGSISGTLLGFYLVFAGSADVLSPLQLLLFLALWLLPVLLLTWNVDQI